MMVFCLDYNEIFLSLKYIPYSPMSDSYLWIGNVFFWYNFCFSRFYEKLLWKGKKNNVTSMREMLLRAFSTQFNGMKNEVYYYHMLTFSHNKFFLPSFNVALNSSRGKSWKTYACLANILTAATKNRKLVDLCFRTSDICNIRTKIFL